MRSAFPDMIRCPGSSGAPCTATVSSGGKTSRDDDWTTEHLHDSGWQVVNGEWTCPKHLPADRVGRGRRNPHCSNCGDLRGGPYGHEAYECMWGGPA